MMYDTLRPGDRIDYDAALWGPVLTYEMLREMAGRLVLVAEEWYPTSDTKDAAAPDVEVMRVIGERDGCIILEDKDGPTFPFQIWPDEMAVPDDPTQDFTRVWALRDGAAAPTAPAPAAAPAPVAPAPAAVAAQVLSVESPFFAAMRGDLDAMLQRTVMQLLAKDSEEATVTIKLGLHLVRGTDTMGRDVILPQTEHKITSVMTVKDETKGGSADECELVFDAEAGRYLLRELPHEEQLTLL